MMNERCTPEKCRNCSNPATSRGPGDDVALCGFALHLIPDADRMLADPGEPSRSRNGRG
jgi:hypothetical protein